MYSTQPRWAAAQKVLLLVSILVALPVRAGILGEHHFTWWDDPGAGTVVVLPQGDPAPSPNAIALFDLDEWHLDEPQTTDWYDGAPVPGLPDNPFDPANRTGLYGGILPVAGAEAFIYQLSNVAYGSGNSRSFSSPIPPGPGINDLSGINIVDNGALNITAPAPRSQFMFTDKGGSQILDLTPSGVAGQVQDWEFNAFAGVGNFEWDIRPEIGGDGIARTEAGVFGYAMPGNWIDDINRGWAHSWNDPMPGSSQVNITPTLPGFSGPVGREKPPLVPKWSQLPQDGLGENLPSDVDWRLVVNPDPAVTAPNWVLADDFRSDGRPIVAVRWWGSYLNPENQPRETEPGVFVPPVEDGFVISFFSDIPADPNRPFSQPGDLLGTYVAPVSGVRIRPTDQVGWDDHRVWEYEVELEWTHLEHAIPGLSEPDAFLEKEGTIYWLSILAENGHEIDSANWEVFPNDDPFEQEHFWGWHTSPDQFNDSAVVGMLAMPSPEEWLYETWNPVDAIVVHDLRDLSFELLTPEPSSAVLVLGWLALIAFARRRHS